MCFSGTSNYEKFPRNFENNNPQTGRPPKFYGIFSFTLLVFGKIFVTKIETFLPCLHQAVDQIPS